MLWTAVVESGNSENTFLLLLQKMSDTKSPASPAVAQKPRKITPFLMFTGQAGLCCFRFSCFCVSVFFVDCVSAQKPPSNFTCRCSPAVKLPKSKSMEKTAQQAMKAKSKPRCCASLIRSVLLLCFFDLRAHAVLCCRK